jgi:hypothetical protein
MRMIVSISSSTAVVPASAVVCDCAGIVPESTVVPASACFVTVAVPASSATTAVI